MIRTYLLIASLLIGLSLQFTSTTNFLDYRNGGRTQYQRISVLPYTTVSGGISLTVHAIGDLDLSTEYLAITVDGTNWVWLNDNLNDDPFYTTVSLASCTAFCGSYTSGYHMDDHGISVGTLIGTYYVPNALASVWLTDGYIPVTITWGIDTSYLVFENGQTSIPDYFSISFSFIPGSVVGDPHVFTVNGDNFELFAGMYTFFANELVTINARCTEPYHGFFVTEIAVMFDDGESSWTLHGVVDQHYVPHLYFNQVEILPGTVLLDGRLIFTENLHDIVHFAGEANEGYIRSQCNIELPDLTHVNIRIGIDELAGGFFEFVVNPAAITEERSAPSGMLMMSKETRSLDGVEKFAVDDIFAIPELN